MTKSMAKTETISICSLSEYLKALREFRSNSNDSICYRGQANMWPLLPKVGRKNSWSNDDEKDDKANAVFQAFDTLARPYFESANLSVWEKIGIAQHHGLPTPFLDWSLNPLVALWFAVSEKNCQTDWQPIVWMFERTDMFIADIDKYTPFTIKSTSVYLPAHVTPRISAQSGLFTVHRYVSAKNSYLPMESNTYFTDNLRSICIDTSVRSEICAELQTIGIHAGTLFPGLDGLAKNLADQHGF
jgi:FRG domain